MVTPERARPGWLPAWRALPAERWIHRMATTAESERHRRTQRLLVLANDRRNSAFVCPTYSLAITDAHRYRPVAAL